MNRPPRYWAVVPAAGVGRRMGSAVPKQYLRLGGRCVIEHTLGRLLDYPRISAVAVAVGEQDGWWPGTDYADHESVLRVAGGAERCHSVLNGLSALEAVAQPDDWVLVHDAARPCLRIQDIDRLLSELQGHPVGGLLGVPVRDTMKRCDAHGGVTDTVERTGLWHAYTPQMFRLRALREALRQALSNGLLITDEAGAMEAAGLRPRMIEGHADNIKITRPEDLPLAAFYLAQQASG